MLQNEIYSKQALGNAGQISKAEHAFLATQTGVAVNDIKVGSAVGIGTNQGEITNTNLTADNFLGFCVKDRLINAVSDTDIYPSGSNVTAITKGSIYIKAPATATQGQAVNITSAGVVSFGTVGSGAFDTGWRVSVGGASGDVIEITTTYKG